jgi:hypothetical protein
LRAADADGLGTAQLVQPPEVPTNESLNQDCALAPDLESMLLTRMRKIFLQQYLPKADIAACSFKSLVSPAV